MLSLVLLGACDGGPTQAAGALGGLAPKAAKPSVAPKTAPKPVIEKEGVQPVKQIPTPIPRQGAVQPKGNAKALVGGDGTRSIPTPIP